MKMAKCGLYKYSFCTHKHDATECANCLLIKRHGKMYKFINGIKYKKCPHCGEYKPLNEFKTNSQGNKSWCYKCQKEYARKHAQTKKIEEKPFVRVYYTEENKYLQIPMNIKEFKKFIKEFIENNTQKHFEVSKNNLK